MAKGKVATKPMTKSEVVEMLVEELELEKKVVKNMLAAFPQIIGKHVKKSGVFVLPGVARFQKRMLPAVKAKSKKVRNPATGELVWQKPRPASIKVTVRPAAPLKAAVNA